MVLNKKHLFAVLDGIIFVIACLVGSLIILSILYGLDMIVTGNMLFTCKDLYQLESIVLLVSVIIFPMEYLVEDMRDDEY